MKRDSRKRDTLEKQPEATLQPTAEEIEAQQVIELPDREAVTIVNTNVSLPVGTSAAAGLVTSS